MNDSLADRVALVTGGARRVGAAIARRLHAAGARVAIHYRGSEEHAARLEGELCARRAGSACRVRGDLLAEATPETLVASVLEHFQRLDLLVNNASLFYPTPLGAIEPRQWEELIGANVRAPLFLAQAAASELAKRHGSIVNIVDIHAERPLIGYPVYTIAKAALAGLTRSLAVELAPEVRVNGIAPGAIAWPQDGQFEAPERTRILETTPLGRLGGFEEIAQAVEFLSVARYVTGQILAVDGGRSVFI